MAKVSVPVEQPFNVAKQSFSTDIPLLMSYYESKISLLLTISQSRTGAVYVMNAGLFQAVRTSGLFSVDPDIGVGESYSIN